MPGAVIMLVRELFTHGDRSCVQLLSLIPSHRLAASALGRSLLGGGLPTGVLPPPPPGIEAPLMDSMGHQGGREARPRRAKSARLAAQAYTSMSYTKGDVQCIISLWRAQFVPETIPGADSVIFRVEVSCFWQCLEYSSDGGTCAVQAVMRQQFDAVVAQLTGGGGAAAGPTQEVAEAIATAAPTLQVHMHPSRPANRPQRPRVIMPRRMSHLFENLFYAPCRPCWSRCLMVQAADTQRCAGSRLSWVQTR
jgi:hypothetical protein